jgi:hypothetical protein
MGKYLVFASMGFELVGLILGAYYFGKYLDGKYNGGGLYFIGLSFGVLIAWLIQILLLVQRFAKDDESAEKTEKSP